MIREKWELPPMETSVNPPMETSEVPLMENSNRNPYGRVTSERDPLRWKAPFETL